MNIHIVKQPEFAAVFTLPSPAMDHSGIGHLVEHLVFRTSTLFPERHNLFALTSITRCKMNASTTGDKSYYFVQANTAEDLLLLIEYLYAGLMTHTYAACDIEQEKSVIQHELAFYAKHPAYQRQSQIWRGDQHPDAYQHWGGFPDMLAQITAHDVYTYKSQYYQDSALTLIASGITEADIYHVSRRVRNKLSVQNEQVLKSIKRPIIYQIKSVNIVENETTTSKIFSWWLPAQYQKSVQAQLPIWQTQWPELYIEEELNHRGMFAIRYLCEASIQSFTTWVRQQVVTAEPQLTTMEQFPECIQTLLAHELLNNDIAVYGALQSAAPNSHQLDHQDLANISTSSISQLIGEPNISYLAKLPVHMVLKTAPIDSPKLPTATHFESPTIIKRFTDTVNCILGSYQPRTIALLLEDMGDDAFYIKKDMWVIKESDIPPETMTAICQSAAFWAPRVQGQLYTMGVFEKGGLFYIWGVGDNNPADNMAYMLGLIRSNRH